MGTMRLILIRHGQTPNNIRGLLDTAVPGPGLTPLGLKQSQAVPEEVEGQRIDALYASNLTRTQLTATPLAAVRALDPLVRDGIREISAGDLEMKGDQESIMAYLKVLMSWFGGDLSARIPGADNGFEVLERFDAVVAEAAAHESVAMVSHGAMIRFWAAHRARNVDWTDPKYRMLGNTGTVTLEGEPTGSDAPGGWTLLDWHAEAAGGLQGDDIPDPTGGAAGTALGGKPHS